MAEWYEVHAHDSVSGEDAVLRDVEGVQLEVSDMEWMADDGTLYYVTTDTVQWPFLFL